MSAQTLTTKKTSPLRYLGVYLFVAALALAALTFALSISDTRGSWVHPVASATEGFTLVKPVVSYSIVGGIAMILLMAALVLTARNAMTVPSVISAVIIMLGIVLGILIATTPHMVSSSAVKSDSSQAAFDQWSAARYGIDTSALDPEQKSTLMWLSMFRDASPLVKLPGTGQLVSMTRIDGNDLYLITGNTEVPVLGTSDTVTANK